MIESLQAENADLKKNLGLAGSKQNEMKDLQITTKFEELISKHCRPFFNTYMSCIYSGTSLQWASWEQKFCPL